jgi:hypothetical protein
MAEKAAAVWVIKFCIHTVIVVFGSSLFFRKEYKVYYNPGLAVCIGRI